MGRDRKFIQKRVNAMNRYSAIITIQDPDRVILSGLPFQPGDRVEVRIEKQHEPSRGREWLDFFDQVDQAARMRPVSEEEIVAEIDAYRAGR